MSETKSAADLQHAIDCARAAGARELTVGGRYEIAEPIRLPSHFTLYLEDAYLRMADGVMCQMFVGEHTLTAPRGDCEISIVGRGCTTLDGGEYNGLSERNSGKDGMPPISQNNMILLAGVEGFRIENLRIINQRWWAINLLFCGNGVLRDLEFCACDLRRTPDGEFVHGLLRREYEGTYVKNADGIDLRVGCHDILIENISGFTEDDMIALTALCGKLEERFACEGKDRTIRNITLRRIHGAAYCSLVRLLNQGGERIENIRISDLCDTAPASPHLDYGINTLRVGDDHLYGARHATPDETVGIVAEGIVGAGENALSLAGAMKDCRFSGIRTAAARTRAVLNTAICENVVIEE